MNIGFIGIGSMGGMLVRGLLGSERVAEESVWLANRSSARLDPIAAKFPGVHRASNREVASHCDLIFLCVGDRDVAEVLAEIDSSLSSKHLLLSISGSISLGKLENRVPCRVAKVIPSITQEIGAGVVLVMYGSRVTADDRTLIEDLLGQTGQPVVIAEAQMQPAISLTSGGPALLAYLLQSMAEEAVRSNLELAPELAWKLVHETLKGTIGLLDEAQMNSEDIIRRVAVPGGMTEAAIKVMSRSIPQAWRDVFRETAEQRAKGQQSLRL